MRFWILLALPVALFAGSPEDPYAALVRQATDLAAKRNFAESASMLRQTLERAQNDGAQIWVAPILNDLGTVLQEQGKYSEAKKAYEEAVKKARAFGLQNRAPEASALGNLGSLYYEAGLLTKGVQFLNESISVMKEAAIGGAMLAKALNNLGVAYLAQHKEDLAQSTAEDALNIWTKLEGPDSGDAAFSYSVLGAAYHHSGRPKDAEPALERAVEIWKKAYGPEDVRTAKGLVNLGAFYMDNGRPERAKPLFDQARPVFERGGVVDRFVLHFYETDAVLQKKLGYGKEAKALRQERDRLQSQSAAQAIAPGMIDASAFVSSK